MGGQRHEETTRRTAAIQAAREERAGAVGPVAGCHGRRPRLGPPGHWNCTMKRPRCKIEEEMAAACRSSRRRRLVPVRRPTVALLLLLAGLGSPSSTSCHAFAIGGSRYSAGSGASLGRHLGRSQTHHVSASTRRLHWATLFTQDGQDERNQPTRTTKAKAKANKGKAKGRGVGRRRPSPNKRTSLKWVVESVEACLGRERGYRSEYSSSHVEEKKDGATPCDWHEQDLQLVDALWELCWGELSSGFADLFGFLTKFSDFLTIQL